MRQNHNICMKCWESVGHPQFVCAVGGTVCCFCGGKITAGLVVSSSDVLDCMHYRNGTVIRNSRVHKCEVCGILTNSPDPKYCFSHAY